MASKTPVCFIIFRRPEHTRRVFERIRQARPPFLYVAADGPRPWRLDDRPLVDAARREIRVDWPCEVVLDYAEINYGCGWRMATAVTRAFQQVDRLVMLEDDTLPHPDYFPLVDDLLDRYQADKHIWCISGAKANRKPMADDAPSYYFSHQVWTCSLATWKDRWLYYDFFARQWGDRFYRNALRSRLENDPNELGLWARAMDEAFVESSRPFYQTFDYQFQYWVKAFGYGIVTSHNMITNIGFDALGTNATDPNSPVANLPAYGMSFPLRHPPLPPPVCDIPEPIIYPEALQR